VVPGAPSWKPLPALFTTPLALLGGGASTAWLLVARASGIAALALAYRLAARFAGAVAGVLATLGLLLSTDWLRGFAHGYSEPLATALVLGAADRQLAGRPRQALLLGALVALARPEAWVLAVAYGLYLWRRGRVHPLLVVAVAVIVPALWLVPDWLGSGDPFHASKVSDAVEPSGFAATLSAVGSAVLIGPVPLTVGAVCGTALAVRRGDRQLVGLAAVALVWAGVLTAMMLTGYPAAPRFFALPAALVCVVGAVGLVRVVTAVGSRRARMAVAAAIVLASLPPVVVRTAGTLGEQGDAIDRARLESDLRRAVDRARIPLERCGTPVLPAGLGWTKGVIAWNLDVPLRRVRGVHTSASRYVEALGDPYGNPRVTRPPDGYVTIRPRRRPFVLIVPFGGARIRLAGRPRAQLRTLAAAGRWRVEASPRCRALRGSRATARPGAGGSPLSAE
jgi:hypothetical protein